MTVNATPLGMPKPGLSWPVGARIRLGAAKARWLRFGRGRRARLNVCVITLIGMHPAVVTRLTLYGAILSGGRRLKRREMIALRLPSGWRVKARVQWRFGSRCGVAFLTPVADFARILCEGAAVRSPEQRRRAPVSSARLAVVSQEPPPCAPAPAFTDRLLGLAAWAKARAERIRGRAQ
jgi:hypothetical protein